MSEAMNTARKIVEDFEDHFGDITATEGDWLARKIAEAIQARAIRPEPLAHIKGTRET